MEHCNPEMLEDILNNVVEFEQIFFDPLLAVHDVNVQAACGTADCVLWIS